MNNSENHKLNLNSDFEEAYILSERIFSHEALLDMLTNGSVKEKQIAALKFDYVSNLNDIEVLLNNLVGCDGKIREATAFKINCIITENSNTHKLFANISAATFAKATIDINANICRLIVDCASKLNKYTEFSKTYITKIIQYTNEALVEMEKFVFRDKKYVINKQLFKLYWCLEAIKYFISYIDYALLNNILNKCSEIQEYTIREKCAEIVLISNNFPNLQHKFINDSNYYVRQVITSSKHLLTNPDDHALNNQ